MHDVHSESESIHGRVVVTVIAKPMENITLGAEVTGIRLADLAPGDWARIYDAFLEFGVLVFPGQHLTEKEQNNFAKRFGETEQLSPLQKGPSVPISNKKPDGTLATPNDQGYKLLRGNEGWHTDSTYMPLASKAAMLSAIEVPDQGGETEFADMRAAWDELDPTTQEELEQLSAYHSLYYSQERAGFKHTTDNIYGLHDKGAPLRPVIKKHPETGRKSIYTGRHAYGIPGMTYEQSRVLLDKLMENACQSPRTYKHKWAPGDIVVWDNRCVMHRARPYDESLPRILRGARISGDPETELAETFEDQRAEAFLPSQSNLSSVRN